MSSLFNCGKVSKSEYFFIDLYHDYEQSNFYHKEFFTTFGATKCQ